MQLGRFNTVLSVNMKYHLSPHPGHGKKHGLTAVDQTTSGIRGIRRNS